MGYGQPNVNSLHLRMLCYIAVLISAHEPSISQEREAVQMRTVAAFCSFKVHVLKFVAILLVCTQAGLFSYVVLVDYGIKTSYVTLEELLLMDSQPSSSAKLIKQPHF